MGKVSGQAALPQKRGLEMSVYSLFQSHGWCDQETEFQFDSSYFKSKWLHMVSDMRSGQYRVSLPPHVWE